MKPSQIAAILAGLQPEIASAQMLVALGLTTVSKIKTYFSSRTDDDAVLAAIMAEVDARIARRS